MVRLSAPRPRLVATDLDGTVVRTDGTISPRTVRHRLGMLRNFFERLIEWEWGDAPTESTAP